MVPQKSTKNNISYFTPNHGRTESHLKVPEAYYLHVCPSACGRRFIIHALSNRENNAACLAITETDIVSGHYEDIIGDAVRELLAELTEHPRVIIIYFHCIDDFLGTDEKALLKTLRAQYPSLRFTVCHMDPITLDAKIKPGFRIYSQIYGLLEYSGKKDDGVNLIGNRIAVDAESELFSVLFGWGITHVRQRIGCKTFAEYQLMADSRLNLVMTPVTQYAAQNMLRKLDIPFLMNMVSYDMNEIVRQYHQIAGLLGKESPDFSDEIRRTQTVIDQTLKHIGKTPVSVDSAASCLPFGLARALCGYGFNVRAVFFIRMQEADRESRSWLEEHYPRVSPVRTENYELLMGADFDKESIAIGFDCAYTLRANHFVDIHHDESFYGFHGVRKLMRLIREAYDTKADWERIKEMDKELLRL